MAGKQRTRIPRKARRARNKKYKFSDKQHPAEGIASFLLGVAAWLLTGASIIFSERRAGEAGILVGALGTVAMLAGFIGFLLAVHSFRGKEIHYRFPVMGSILNGVLFLFLLILYGMGAALL